MNDINDKIKELEARNSQLKTEVAVLETRNSQLAAMSSVAANDEIDLRELWNAIWSGKWIIIGITFVFAVGSVFYALSLPNEYKSTAILAPASQAGGAGGLAKLAGQFGGLASLAGINLGGAGGEDKTVIAMEIMKTWGFIEKFIEDNQIQAEVFAAKGWNRATNQIIYDTDLYDPVSKKWVREFNPAKGEKLEPSSWELYEKFTEMMTVVQNQESGLIRVSIEYYSPELSKIWVGSLVKSINEYIREVDRVEAEKSINYLKKQIALTPVADMQSVFYELIEEQTKTVMLAEISEEYVFKTISEARIMEEKSEPKRAIICIAITFLGGLIGTAIALFRSRENLLNKKH